MKIKISRADGSIIEAEGTPEECAVLAGLTPPEDLRKMIQEEIAKVPASIWVSPFRPIPYTTPVYPYPYTIPVENPYPWWRGSTSGGAVIPSLGTLLFNGDVNTHEIVSSSFRLNPSDQVSFTSTFSLGSTIQ